MLQARRVGFFRSDYEITVDGRLVTRWASRTWRTGGTFELDGARYEVGANFLGSRYVMADEHGKHIAAADRVGRKQWTVTAGDTVYEFSRDSAWRRDQALIRGGVVVGSVRRPSAWRSDAEADLPGLPLAVQLFVLVVVLTMWEAQDSSAAASS